MKAIVDFSDRFVDEKMDFGTSVKVGDAEVDLSTLRTDRLLSAGFLRSTKLRNAQKGGAQVAAL